MLAKLLNKCHGIDVAATTTHPLANMLYGNGPCVADRSIAALVMTNLLQPNWPRSRVIAWTSDVVTLEIKEMGDQYKVHSGVDAALLLSVREFVEHNRSSRDTA